MRNLIAALSALVLGFGATAAAADDAPRSVSDYVNVLDASAQRLDDQVTDLQKAGDMAAAQRVVLAAGMVRRSSEEFRRAEQASLTDDLSGLPAPAPDRVAALVAMAKAAQTRAAADPAFIAEAQRVADALLDAVPMLPAHPVIFGVLSRDLSTAPLAADLVIYGHRLIDPVLKTAPVVLIHKTNVSTLKTTDESIEVTLPADIRHDIGFAPGPCQNRAGFSLRIQESYAELRGLWPITWHNAIDTNTDVFVLPSPIFYTAKIVASVDTATKKILTVPFEQKSELVLADCGETHFTEVDLPLPDGFSNLACSGTWIDAAGAAKAAGRCAVDGQNLRITGELSGGQKVCSPDKLCTCPNSAQGFLEAKGSYQVQVAGETSKVEAQSDSLTFAAGRLAQGPLYIPPGAKLRHITLAFTHHGCATVVDGLVLNIGDDPNNRADAVSKTGAFRAVYQQGQLTVGAIEAYPMAADKTP